MHSPMHPGLQCSSLGEIQVQQAGAAHEIGTLEQRGHLLGQPLDH
jgi:hypothetical protein